MSRLSAKYGTTHTALLKETLPGSTVVTKQVDYSKKTTIDLSEGLKPALKSIFTGKTRKETDFSGLSVKVVSASPDIHGLQEHGQENPDFTTSKGVRYKADLKFATQEDTNRALDVLNNMKPEDLRDALHSKTLEHVLAEELGLEVAPYNVLKDPAVALFPSHFMAS